MIKHHDQKQAGEERVYLDDTSISLFIIKGSQGQKSRQEMKQKPWSNLLTGSFPEACSAFFFIEFRITAQGMVTPTVDKSHFN